MVGKGGFRGGRGGGAMGKRQRDARPSRGSSQKQQKFGKGRGQKQARNHYETGPSLPVEAGLPPVEAELSISEEENDAILEDNVTAYSTLLQSLQAKGGSFADAYAQRKREEQGASSSDEENEGEELHMGGMNSAEVSDDEANEAIELKSPAPTDEEVELVKENGAGSKNEIVRDDVDNEEHPESEDESEEDVNEARAASGEEAGICSE